jgi:hypothetical protein
LTPYPGWEATVRGALLLTNGVGGPSSRWDTALTVPVTPWFQAGAGAAITFDQHVDGEGRVFMVTHLP